MTARWPTLSAALVLQAAATASHRARALVCLAGISKRRGRPQEGIGYTRQGLAITAERGGDRLGKADTLITLGYCESAVGSYDDAARHFGQSLAIARELGYRTAEAYALGGLGSVESSRGNHREAVELMHQSITAYRELGNLLGEVEMVNLLGDVLLAGDQPELASGQYATALGLAGQAGDEYELARAHDGLAVCCHAASDDDQARRYWHEAIAIFSRIGSAEADQVRARLAAATAAAGVSGRGHRG